MFEKIKLSNEYKKYAKTNRSQKTSNIKQMNRVQNIRIETWIYKDVSSSPKISFPKSPGRRLF